ncbi:LacI family transcriptional regulator [Yersinia entomophaga]|uniref:LacI family transcriptional regulator n=1 Tax=Yersinia entomophaga TaxID=935293 RepID=A0ABN4PUE4_YERET|nr:MULTISPECIES: LacI family DNA-binding transcriptional regulator [Yersinia]ANI30611.1 LacI family transcriptional regulator [Yersinia entomophaga]OWF87984.1 LacI family transcriptional regulator [Yersinia entomophaga]
MSSTKGPRPSGRATINDVAKSAKTGKTSVSRYLNGEHNLLSDRLKLRIEEAIAKLNYRPSQVARSLKRGRTRLIGLILADITNPYSIDVMRGIEAACRAHGFTLLMCNTNNQVEQEQHYLQLLGSYQVEGIVVNAVGMREEALSMLQQSRLPMVLIDRKIAGFSCDMIGLNNAEAAIMATNHLVEQNYQSILFLSEPLGLVNTRRDRLMAFKAAMAVHPERASEHAEVTLEDSQRINNIVDQFNQKHGDKRRAILVANGSLTLQLARTLRHNNIQWGIDIGLLGFDELPWAELAGVGITTLKQPTYQIGYAALEQLVKRMQGSDEPPADIMFSGELVIRGSTQL